MSDDQKILDLARHKGLLKDPRVDASDDLAALVKKGVLDADTVGRLRHEVEARMEAATNPGLLTTPGGISPAPVITGAEEPTHGKAWGPFEHLEFLGQGGMARVFKAYDPNLQRHVALKVIRMDDPEMAARLVYEAKAQARIEHPNVCKVYEAGEVAGHPYIAMQYIQGRTLRDLHGELPMEQKLRLMIEVCEGVHAAHRAGLIHRDLKPSNIMAEQQDDGEWVPYVLDFGLARQAGSTGMTETGRVVGTIRYMSPEQARGKVRSLDRRSDVYSLGITLYELIANSSPYSMGSDVDFLVSLVDQDTSVIRKMDPEIPEDLSVIVMKCVEKEPHRRYDSARALADDLERYLNGDPILARKTQVWYRIWKTVRKHRAVASVAVAALIAVLVLAGAWWRTRSLARQGAELSQQLGQEVERMEAVLRHTRLSPLHDASPRIRMVRSEMESLQKKAAALGSAGQAAADYALGRAHLALDEPEQAHLLLTRAWDSGYRNPEISYALGRALGELYQARVREAENGGTPPSKKKMEDLDRQYRVPALTYLKSAKGIRLESRLYLEALIAFYDGDFPRTLKLARQAADSAPWLFEAWRLTGDAYAQLANEKRDAGDYGDALQDYTRAEESFGQSIRIGESDSGGYLGLCELQCEIMTMHIYQTGQDPAPNLQKAVDACNQALRTDPYNDDALLLLSEAYWRFGEHEVLSGGDPSANLRRSMDLAQQLINSNPDSEEAIKNLAIARSIQAQYENQEGWDPTPTYRLAIEAFEKVAPKTADTQTYNNLGLAYYDLGSYEMSKGKDPRPLIENSIQNLKKSFDLDPEALASGNLGNPYALRAEYLFAIHKDPWPDVTEAEKWYSEALRQNPNDALSLSNLAMLRISAARYRLSEGQSPEQQITEANQFLERCLSLKPGDSGALSWLGESLLVEMEWRVRQHADIQDLSGRMKQVVEQLANDPEQDAVEDGIARWFALEAESALQQKKAASGLIEQGLLHADRAIEMTPDEPEYLGTKGTLLVLRAQSRGQASLRSQDAKAAKELFDRMLEKNSALGRDFDPFLKQLANLL